MSRDQPLVSVGMPVYNEARWIRQALDTLLAQTLEDFELIISDNASTDGTWDLLQEYAVQDSRIRLHRQQENRGALTNFGLVLDQARAEYFIWASGHDLWSSNLLEVLVGELQANHGVALCIPQGVWIDEDNRSIKDYDGAIDTRGAIAPASRVLLSVQQMARCNAIYGLHRRHILLQAMPWPKMFGSDFIVLVRIASLADIITNPSACWFRREQRQETRHVRIQRHLADLEVTGYSARFPYLASRVAIMVEYLKAKGSFHEKVSLLWYGVRKLFLEPVQFRLLVKEFLLGSRAMVQRQ